MGFGWWATEQLEEVTRLVGRQVATDFGKVGQAGSGENTPSQVGNLLTLEGL